jgi:site-specific DNA recombinase
MTAEIETAVIDQVRRLFQSPEIVVATWRAAKSNNSKLMEQQVGNAIEQFDELWAELFPAEQARIVQLLVERVDISEQVPTSSSGSMG